MALVDPQIGEQERHRLREHRGARVRVDRQLVQRDAARRHKFRYDLVYVRSQSLWLDLKLIALSFWITFRGKWEHRGKKF
jgi:lipopolysaccharide/colanic/teichoic acid biosynthesis glycosyltransferase